MTDLMRAIIKYDNERKAERERTRKYIWSQSKPFKLSSGGVGRELTGAAIDRNVLRAGYDLYGFRE